MNHFFKRSAFTMIELLFVIVILGIVAGFALEAIRSYYEGIFRTAEYTKRVATADQVLEQLSKYFENAISTSIVNLDQGATTGCNGTPVLNDLNDYTVAFVSVDQDSLLGNGTIVPGWNEDVNISGSTITMRGGDYTIANSIIGTLSGLSFYDAAIYNNSGIGTTCRAFNWDNTGGTLEKYFIPVNNLTSSTITVDRPLVEGKRAYLLRTGYAFRVDDNGSFWMYNNFMPWQSIRYTSGNKNLLAENVAHFYADYDAQDFQNQINLNDRGLVWRLKVCMRGIDSNLSESGSSSNDICRERRVHVRY
jgi:prepilin-type N-terminal cleavage/methylation domain-containing protein